MHTGSAYQNLPCKATPHKSSMLLECDTKFCNCHGRGKGLKGVEAGLEY